jgi:hypothetical protein
MTTVYSLFIKKVSGTSLYGAGKSVRKLVRIAGRGLDPERDKSVALQWSLTCSVSGIKIGRRNTGKVKGASGQSSVEEML